ncbi:MAG: hypothetical protein HY710_02500, partial [Candidatus Latescibacteria bacterium]|nr:hypothetical protein [Candidatus Latescibacterota bacterium]
MRKSFIAFVWIVAVLGVMMGDGLAQVTTTWTGGTSSAWDDPLNWNNGVPGAADNAIINPASFNPVLNVDAAVNDLTINGGALLTVNGQSLSIGGDLTVTISNTNPDGLIMTAPNDVVTVEGVATFTTVSNHGSADSQGQFTAGLLRLRGGFTQTRNGALASQKSFVSTGTRVVCDGEGSQSIAFSNPSVSVSR